MRSLKIVNIMRLMILTVCVYAHSPPLSHAQPLIPTIESLEATIVNSDYVHIGKVIGFQKTIHQGAGNDYDVSIQVEETLKAEPFLDEPYRKLSVPVQNSETELQRWKEHSSRILIASKSFRPLATTVINLSEEELQVMTADMTLLRDPEDIISASRAALRRLPANVQRVHTFNLIVPHKIIKGTDWDTGYLMGGYLTVPVDEHLERQLHQLLESGDPFHRSEAAKGLYYFKSVENVEILKSLLDDPGFTIVVDDEGISEHRFYSVRSRAFLTLKEWGVDVDKPLLRESGATQGDPISDVPGQWKQSIERPNRQWDFDGQRILGRHGQDVCLWDATTGKLLHRWKVHQEIIEKVQLGPHGQHALSSSWVTRGPMIPNVSEDTRTVLWDLSTGKKKHDFPGQVAGEFSPDGKQIITFSERAPSSYTFDAAVWDVNTGQQLLKVVLEDRVNPYWDTLHFSPDGRQLVYFEHGKGLQYNSSGIVLYDSQNGRELGRASAKNGIHRYTSTGLLACFDNEQISLTDIEAGKVLSNTKHQTTSGWVGAITHDGEKVLAYPTSGVIHVWDTKTAAVMKGAPAGRYPQKRPAISPDDKILALPWTDHSAMPEVSAFGLYEVSTGKEIAVHEFSNHSFQIGFSPDSTTILFGGPTFELFSARDGKKLRSFTLEQYDLE